MSRSPTSLLAKFVSEQDTFAAVFTLADGETISSCTATPSVLWGTDVSVAAMAPGAVTIAGDTCTVLVIAGVAGNVYNLRFTATTSTGRVLINDSIFEVRA
jgi:hypothetical protein